MRFAKKSWKSFIMILRGIAREKKSNYFVSEIDRRDRYIHHSTNNLFAIPATVEKAERPVATEQSAKNRVASKRSLEPQAAYNLVLEELPGPWFSGQSDTQLKAEEREADGVVVLRRGS